MAINAYIEHGCVVRPVAAGGEPRCGKTTTCRSGHGGRPESIRSIVLTSTAALHDGILPSTDICAPALTDRVATREVCYSVVFCRWIAAPAAERVVTRPSVACGPNNTAESPYVGVKGAARTRSWSKGGRIVEDQARILKTLASLATFSNSQP